MNSNSASLHLPRIMGDRARPQHSIPVSSGTGILPVILHGLEGRATEWETCL